MAGDFATADALPSPNMPAPQASSRKSPEQSPLLGDIAADGEGGLSQECVDGLSLVGAHGGSSFR